MPSLQVYGVEDESTLSATKNTPIARQIQTLQNELSRSTLAFKKEDDAEGIFVHLIQ